MLYVIRILFFDTLKLSKVSTSTLSTDRRCERSAMSNEDIFVLSYVDRESFIEAFMEIKTVLERIFIAIRNVPGTSLKRRGSILFQRRTKSCVIVK